MLQALNEHGVTPDMIIGTSAGALNGAFLAADPFGGANQLSHLWPGFSRETFFPGSSLEVGSHAAYLEDLPVSQR